MADKTEFEMLARAYGEFPRATFEFANLSGNFAQWVRKLTRRRGEIILIVPCGAEQVWLHTKIFYPEQVYRLPTGGIHQGEGAEAAARREAFEEIGFHPQTLRLLGVLENFFVIDDKRVEYPSFVFQTEAFTQTPAPTDPDEPISDFSCADKIELRATANLLASLPGQWREWGKFRAASHYWLAEHL